MRNLNSIKLPNNYKCKVAIIGLGYVGLPLSLTYVENGYEVLGFDINKEIVEKINNLSLCFNLKRSLYFLMILYQGAKVYFIY